jgi:integrative and conjugative element protein (TIGR02256 family)
VGFGILNWMRQSRGSAWERRFPRTGQRLRIDGRALRHMRKYRQSKLSSVEAGGQLFGTVTSDVVTVVDVSGPYHGDQRSRHSFRSDPRAAQSTIDRFWREGLHYLGEWHTHAELHPALSGSDRLAIRAVFENSQVSTTSLLLVIVGLAPPDDDLAAWYIHAAGGLEGVT